MRGSFRQFGVALAEVDTLGADVAPDAVDEGIGALEARVAGYPGASDYLSAGIHAELSRRQGFGRRKRTNEVEI